MKNVQISQTLFLRLVAYFSVKENPTQEEQKLRDELLLKLDKLVNHLYYTESKTALTAEEREEARKKYLDAVGISKDFRW